MEVQRVKTPRSKLVRMVGMLAPLMSLAVLVALPFLLTTELVFEPGVEARFAVIRKAFDEAPRNIGKWSSEDIVIPVAAEDILKPNAILGRRYTEFTLGSDRREATLMIVHCRDVRDMNGHYPPICYPNSGWALDGQENSVLPFVSGTDESPQKSRWYTFTKKRGSEDEQQLLVYSFFVLPDGTTAVDLSTVSALAGRAASSAKGIAQVQICLSQELNKKTRDDVVRELLGGVSNVMRALGLELEERQ